MAMKGGTLLVVHNPVFEVPEEVKNMKKDIYQENGYENRSDYLKCLAEDYGISHIKVLELANILGEDEDFDLLVTRLADME